MTCAVMVRLLALGLALLSFGAAAAEPDAGSQTTDATHPFVTDAEVIRAISQDSAKASDADRPNLRYFTFTHLANAGEPDAKLKVYAAALAKLLNCLSTRSDPVTPTAVDPTGTIVRVDITRLGWKPSTWDAVAAADPYAVAYNNAQFRSLQGELKTPVPFVKADWFVFAAARAPLYYAILDLPRSKSDLEKKLGLDARRDFEGRQVARAGFQNSGVSPNNRVIERHAIGTGVYWEAYSFAGNGDRRSVFEFPLGPPGAFGPLSDKFGFAHDEGQVIFSLPNGFYGYFATDAKGERIEADSSRILPDPEQRDRTATVAVSCMGCHDGGIKLNDRHPGRALDQVRDLVSRSGTFPFEVKDVVTQIFPGDETFAKLMEGDAKRYADALAAAGLDSNTKLDGVEPVRALSARFEDNLTPRLAAAEFGLDEAAFMDRLGQAGGRAFDLKLRLQDNIASRDAFSAGYGALLGQIADNGDKAIEPPAPAVTLVKPPAAAKPGPGPGGRRPTRYPASAYHH